MAGHRSKKRKHDYTAEPQAFDVEAMLDKLWWTEPEKCEDAAEHKIATLLARAHLNVTTSWYKDEGWHGDVLQMLLHIGEAFRELKMAHAVVLRKIQHKFEQQHDDNTQEAAFFVMQQQLKAEEQRSEELVQELHAQADLYRNESLKLPAASHSRLYDFLDQITAENEAYQKEIDRLSAGAILKISKPGETVEKSPNTTVLIDKRKTYRIKGKTRTSRSKGPLLISDKAYIPDVKEDHENEKSTPSTCITSPPKHTLLDLAGESKQTMLDWAEESKQTNRQYQNLLQQLEKSNKDLQRQRALRETIAQDYGELLEQQGERYNEDIARLKIEHDRALQKQAEEFRKAVIGTIDSLLVVP